MDMIFKSAALEKAHMTDQELELINQQALGELKAEDVYTFRLVACDNQVDRDRERFTEATLAEFAELYVGRPVLMDHTWSAKNQTARVYAGAVEPSGAVQRLVLRCYMVRTESNADTIAAIDGGILRECSVGCTVKRALCSICGADQRLTCCEHVPGKDYNGQTCHIDLDGAADAYEVSLVAVPAQPGAGVIKTKRYGGTEPPAASDPQDVWKRKAALRLAQAKYKYF